jgi:hypothetical protein
MARESRSNRAKKKLAKSIDDRLEMAIRAALKTPDGRTLLFELQREAGLLRSCWDNSEDGFKASLGMARKIGNQEYARWLYDQCFSADEQNSELMLREGRAFDAQVALRVKAQVDAEPENEDEDTEP